MGEIEGAQDVGIFSYDAHASALAQRAGIFFYQVGIEGLLGTCSAASEDDLREFHSTCVAGFVVHLQCLARRCIGSGFEFDYDIALCVCGEACSTVATSSIASVLEIELFFKRKSLTPAVNYI